MNKLVYYDVLTTNSTKREKTTRKKSAAGSFVSFIRAGCFIIVNEVLKDSVFVMTVK